MKGSPISAFFSPVLLFILSFALIFSSCVTAEEGDIIPVGGDNVMVSFDLEGEGGAPITYAIDGDPERNISELDILLFDLNGKLAYAPINGVISAMNPTTGKSRVTATVTRAHYGNIIILANARGMVNAALIDPSTPLAVGMPQDEAMKLINLTLPGKWNTDTSSGGYVGIPMYGETGYVNVNLVGDNIFNTTLLRMLTRVDVAVTEAVKPHFELKSIRVYNRNSVGMLAKSATVGKPNLPADPQKIATPLIYNGTEITDLKISSVGEIYLFESAIVNTLDATKRLPEATCLVVGGFYSADGITMGATELFYRVDFAQMDANDIKHFYDIIRNHQYNINIVSVTGPGLEDPDEALNTELSRIDVEVVDWGNGGDIGGAIDGQNILRVDPGSLTLSYLERTTASLDNKVSVSSTHADGWYISKITELVGAVENDISTGGWLSTSLPLNDPQMAERTFSTILSENDGAARVGYIYINSGPRMSYKMKVTQNIGLRLANIVWVDYDGANDVDPRLTTITVEQSGSATATQTSGIANGAINPVINIDGTITKITLTYSGYALDVPVAKYSVNALTKTLNVTDRTLIGKAIHMENIRLDLKGSYIQVSDVDLITYTNWVPIGVNLPLVSRFTGSYYGGDGNGGAGYKIENLNINRTTDHIGLFGCAYGSTLKNIHIASGSIKGRNYAGAICGNATTLTTITNCSSNVPVTVTGYGAGGICGLNNAAIINSHNLVAGSINGTHRLGGICGENSGSGSIDGCTNAATISTATTQVGSNIGGICGSSLTTLSKIINCDNLAGASVYGISYVGGICGYSGGEIDHNTNSATITGTGVTSMRIGGICGALNADSKITNCKNLLNGDVSGETYIGGICGDTYTNTIEDCSNAATIRGVGNDPRYVAGISGYGNAGSTITRCHNLAGGNVVGNGQQNGGIFGMNYGIVWLCTNAAKVTGGMDVGGIGGFNNEAAAEVIDCDNLTGGIIDGGSMVGGICGYNLGTIKDCENNESVKGVSHTGGICGSNPNPGGASILNCKNLAAGKVVGRNQGTGGIVGNNNQSIISGCTNAATVEGISSIGGIVGESVGASSKVESCENLLTGAVTGTGEYVGGIVGQHGNNTLPAGERIYKCINSGPVSATSTTHRYVGGICGANGNVSIIGISGTKIEDCENNGTVSGAFDLVGGIAGSSIGASAIITNCHNRSGANVSGAGTTSEGTGGICGWNTINAKISKCTNNATIHGNVYVGGISGYNAATNSHITNCHNLSGGTIKGIRNMGGITGNNGSNNGNTPGGLILACSNSGSIGSTANNHSGGISGWNHNNGIIRSCVNTGTVEGATNIGGICGWNIGGSVEASYNIATVTGTTGVNAICGLNGKTMTSCYFGGGANNMTAVTGSLEFSATAWPGNTNGWFLTPTGPWVSRGDWNGGAPIYPTLEP